MKKIAVSLLCLVMMFAFVGCGKEEKKNEKTEESVQITDSLEILTTVWNSYGENEKFAIAGSDYNNSVMDAPGAFDVSDAESLDAILGVPADKTTMIDGAASIMHMMNANTFTAGAYHLADSASMDDFTAGLKDNIMNRQWMCGFPDTLIIVSIGNEYVVSAFGAADVIDTFKAKLTTSYPMAEIVYEESLAQ
ncbi:MAG: hypothetical protein E7258_05375 [Lachnospiraceae bacterium]|nr:hypothetical protein [Lachnospiraceae bacterium]